MFNLFLGIVLPKPLVKFRNLMKPLQKAIFLPPQAQNRNHGPLPTQAQNG